MPPGPHMLNTLLPPSPGPCPPPQASESALPADAYVVASPCPAATAAPGSRATAVFTVGANLNPQEFKEVALQVDFPKALLPSSSLKCQTSTAQGESSASAGATAAALTRQQQHDTPAAQHSKRSPPTSLVQPAPSHACASLTHSLLPPPPAALSCCTNLPPPSLQPSPARGPQ